MSKQKQAQNSEKELEKTAKTKTPGKNNRGKKTWTNSPCKGLGGWQGKEAFSCVLKNVFLCFVMYISACGF
jgi:hypothetical protein